MIRLTLKRKKLNFIPANFKNYLINKNIDFFITIAAFQEMTVGEIDNYFKIISSNKSTLYCCSREYKKLVGGEEIYFDKYPWSNSKKILGKLPVESKMVIFALSFHS